MCLLFLCRLYDIIGRDDDLAPRTGRERRPRPRRRDARPSFVFEVALSIEQERRSRQLRCERRGSPWTPPSAVTHRCGLPRGPVTWSNASFGSFSMAGRELGARSSDKRLLFENPSVLMR